MKKLHSRLAALTLVLALCLGLAAPAMAAGKLSTPTDLAWGGEGRSADTMSWSFGENSLGIVHLVVYRNNQVVYDEYGDYGTSDYPGSESLSWGLAFDGTPMESGTYHFTVQNITDFHSTSSNNSAIATSPKWTYTKPAAQMAAPSDPKWDFPYCTWKPGKISNQQESTLLFYYSKTQNGKYYSVGSTTGRPTTGDTARTTMDKWALENGGAGYYKFRVINLSDDVTQVQNSAWSAYSEPYYYDGSPVDICAHIEWDLRNWKEPTCTEPGYSGDYVCADCGEVREVGKVLPAQGHSTDSDGICWNCGQQIECYGILGDYILLYWTYYVETGELAFAGVIPSGETVYVARYQNGRLAGVKAATGSSPRVNVGTAGDQLRLFWLDGNQVPQCPAGSLELPK